jgi:group I intron endonuclease
MSAGIYIIKSSSGKCYVGQTVNFRNRKNEHYYKLRKGIHHNPLLQNTFNKHGESSLIFTKLLVCSLDHLTLYEQLVMDLLKPEYNIYPAGGSPRGIKQSSETIAKRAASNTGKKRTPETCANLSAANQGQVCWNKGGKQSKEWIKKRVASRVMNGTLKHSMRTRRRLRASILEIWAIRKGNTA